MMVGFVRATEQERPAGKALQAAPEAEEPPAKSPVDCGVSAQPWMARKLGAAQALSGPRRRLLRLLQKQLLLQLAANKHGADVDPRRRPPHAATPESILARWIAADPKRLVGGVLALGLHDASPSTVARNIPSNSRQPSFGFAEAAAASERRRAPAAADAWGAPAAPAPGKGYGEPPGTSGATGTTTAAAVAAAPSDPFEASTTCSTSSSSSTATIDNISMSNSGRSGSNTNSALFRRLDGVSGRDHGWSAGAVGVGKYQRPEGADGGGGSSQLRTSCVLCLSPFSSVGGSFLCCVCLHTLKNNRRPWGVEGRARSTAKRNLSSINNPPPKKIAKRRIIMGASRTHRPLQAQPDVCIHPRTPTVIWQPRRRFKRPTSAASAARQLCMQDLQKEGIQQQQDHQKQLEQPQQQQRKDDCTGSTTWHIDAKDVSGWRARAATAAAAAEDSSWWSSTDAPGEPPVVPPLLLPLLPSIFCLHARPWPPPPTKRRRILPRRQRGLDCFVSPAVASQCSLWGSWLAQRESKVQQTRAANTSATGAGAATAYPASPHLVRIPAVAEAAVAAAEVAVAERPQAGGELGTAAPNGAAVVGCLASPSCSPNCCCRPWLTADEHKTPTQGDAISGLNDCYFCPPAISQHGWTHGVVLRRRRERQSEPAFLNVATAIPAAAAPAGAACAVCALRDMATTAAAATLTGQESHQQQTPPPMFRRRSWSAQASRSGATTADTARATVTAVAATRRATRSPAEGAACSRQLCCFKYSTRKAAAAATPAAAGQPSAAAEPLPKVKAATEATAAVSAETAAAEATAAVSAETAAAEATAAVATATSAAAGSEARCCACCLSRVGDSAPSCPVSFKQTGALPTSHSGTDEGFDEGTAREGFDSGYAGPCNGIDEKVVGNGCKKALQGALGTDSADKGLEKGSDRGLDRGGGNGGAGGCVRYSSLARISQGLLVGGSSLGRGSGLGIYTCREFSRRAVICEYSGILIDRRTALLLRHMECASHVVSVQMQHLYLLGFHTPFPLLGGGAFINDGRWNTRGGEGPGICVRFRVMFDKHRATQRVVVVAVKDIPKGSELLTSYDNDYWRLQKGVHAQRTTK